jgi:hypothetical protein
MVNVYQFKREKRIEEITELVKNMKSSGDVFNKKQIIMTIMMKYDVSQRKASEYLEIAIFKNEKA